MDYEHPSISRTMLTGYPFKEDTQAYSHDVLGNAIYLYDDVIAMPEGIYKVASLSDEALSELLEAGGIFQQGE